VKHLLFIAIFSVLALQARAEVPDIKIRGFGTAGFIKGDHPSFYLEEFQTHGKKLTFTPDTRIGLNLFSEFAKDWNVTAQFTARADTKKYTTYLDWGFLSYQAMPELALRLGKVTAPLWLYSQQINIGYSYLWIRPPVEVYSLLNAVKSLNGVSVLSSLNMGTGVLTTELFAGEAKIETDGNNPAQKQVTYLSLDDVVGIDLNFSKNDVWTLHASYAKGRTSAKIESEYTVGSNNLFYKSITPLSLGATHFFSGGTKVDFRNWLFTGEFARRLIAGQSLQSATAWYATAGYRIGKFTPYYTYSWLGKLRGAYFIHPSYPTVTSLKKSQHSHMIGGNLQVHDSVVLKAEVQRSTYRFLNSSLNFHANMVSFAGDFVF
jgi:hypothetical protein